MKKSFLIIFVLLAILCFADTNIPAGSVNGTWTQAGSPYIIQGEIQIDNGDLLNIEPGVEIIFEGHYKFLVYGRLLALGDSLNLITFTAQNSVTGWHGLRFFDSNSNYQDSSKVHYCEFTYGKATGTAPDYQGGALYCINSSDISVRNSIFSNNSATTGGAIYLENSDLNFKHLTVTENNASGSGGGIYLKNSSPTVLFGDISDNNSIFDGGGINCFASDPTLERVLLSDNQTEWNGGGIAAYNNSDVNLINVTFTQNIAFQEGCGVAALYNSDVYILNSIVWENDEHQLFVASTASMTIGYTDVMDGQNGVFVSGDGILNWNDGNIDSDPEFTNPLLDDFSLQPTSPCIDSGSPDPQYNDPDGSRNDMGAIFFHQTGIKGLVTFATGSTGNVEEVEISIAGTSSVTTYPNANGVFFSNLEPGTYSVAASLVGFTPNPLVYSNLILAEGELISGIDFEMTPVLPGTIEGTVDLNGTGVVENVEISAGQVTTNPFLVEDPPYSYYYYILEIAPGYWDVTASLAGFQDSTYYDVPVQSSQITGNINFILEPIPYIGTIEGTVQLRGGTGNVENVEITADTVTVNPDASGFYHMEIRTGLHDVRASLPGYADITREDVQVVYQETEIIDFTMLPWDIIPGTQYVETFYITSSLDGKFVDNRSSNQLAAFGPGGDSDCRGVAVWEDGSHPLWDLQTNYWELPGYWYLTVISNNNSGEQIDFKLYESETDSVYQAYEYVNFEDNLIAAINLTMPSPIRQQEFELIPEWNWISFNLRPFNYAVADIFNPLTPNLIYQIKNQTHSYTYDPVLGWTGDLPTIANGEGYLVYMNQGTDSFIFNGERLNPFTNQISMTENWNWVNYYPVSPRSIENAMESILENVILVKDQTQSATFTGTAWIGDLTTMQPGTSYKIQMAAEDVLTYKGGNPYGSAENYQPLIPENWEMLKGNRSNMIIMAEIYLEEDLIVDPQKFSVGIFDQKMRCRAIGKWEKNFWYFTVRGDIDGEELTCRILDRTTKQEFLTTQSFIYQGDSVLGNFSTPTEIRFDHEIPEASSTLLLTQNVPNPFNPNTQINYNLPQDGKVKLIIYNVKGQSIAELVNEYQKSGMHTVEWDASEHSSGIYFYNLQFGNESLVKKCLMLK